MNQRTLTDNAEYPVALEPVMIRLLAPKGVLQTMLPCKWKQAVTVVLLRAAIAGGLGLVMGLAPTRSAAEEPAATLSPAEFKELRPVMDLKSQPWTTIPWKYSITEARKLAAATKKPIFMVVNSGNCLGCT
jgi:hypothetical protein